MTNEETAMPPTRPVSQAASLLQEGVGRFLRNRSTLPTLGEYESDVEALNLFYLVIRHIESVCTLAKRDLVTLPSAQVVSRAALETTIKILWLLKPDDVFEREARWLAHLISEEEYHQARFDAQTN